LALTDRDKKILELSAAGMTDYKIARRLRSNSGTVLRQRKRAYDKLERARSDVDFADKLKKTVK
jgi:DNA-binding CsgD family transcriptional regulator